ncbi:hypothetical protein AGMMS50229_21010 [Campylobacterota bacterium]|nr:hypothetical protein AGMMS50229_21010 [Campylobacterota bacterium]
MIRPLPPELKVLTAGFVLVLGTLIALRFPAEKTVVLENPPVYRPVQEKSSPQSLFPGFAETVYFDTVSKTVPQETVDEIVQFSAAETAPEVIPSVIAEESENTIAAVQEVIPALPDYIPFQMEQTASVSERNPAFSRQFPDPPCIELTELIPPSTLPPPLTVDNTRESRVIPVSVVRTTLHIPTVSEPPQSEKVIFAQGTVTIHPELSR